jgi:hypothetical protein
MVVDGKGVVAAGVFSVVAVVGLAVGGVVDGVEEAALSEPEQAAVARLAATAIARGNRTKRVMGKGYGLISRADGRGRGNIVL